jgi:thymidylate synthase
MFRETMQCGIETSPRGQKIRELEDCKIIIDPVYPFMNFKHRNLKIDYFKKEMLWKLSGDPFNESIKEHAKMWDSVQNNDGSFNSNYGQYWFGEQLGLFVAFNELVKDVYSRRAVIPMLRASHVGPQVKDTVCTESVGFRIRRGVLNMSVHMRSSDQIFGLGTDIPTFAFLQRLMLGMLRSVYHDLEMGDMTIVAMSSHIYERHFTMVENILREPVVAECSVMPIPSTAEAFKIAASGGNVDPTWGHLSTWLTTAGV